MTSYKDLGFVNTKDMFKKAYEGKYAIPAYNFNNMEQIQAIITACVKTQSPVILQVSAGARKYANADLLKGMAKGAIDMMKKMAKNEGLAEIPVALHLDHGATFEICKDCIDSGFSSVMIDGSHHSFEENIALTKKVVEYAHAHDVSVEVELKMM
jgi:fructose-bisphosphate aldolase class II